ncbi:MAG: hypothetical protein ACXW3Y_15200 [Rhodoplanes sp.]
MPDDRCRRRRRTDERPRGRRRRVPGSCLRGADPARDKLGRDRRTQTALPQATLGPIAAFGDTGWRLKAADKEKSDHDHSGAGRFQDCDKGSKWPFSRLSATAAARKPGLVIHVGDYLYRESPCPTGDIGCKGSPYGDNWATWQADFFRPADRLLAAASMDRCARQPTTARCS